MRPPEETPPQIPVLGWALLAHIGTEIGLAMLTPDEQVHEDLTPTSPFEAMLLRFYEWHLDEATQGARCMDTAANLVTALRDLKGVVVPPITEIPQRVLDDIPTPDLLELLGFPAALMDVDNLVIRGFDREDYREAWDEHMSEDMVLNADSILKTGFEGWAERSDLTIYTDLRLMGTIAQTGDNEALSDQ